MSESQPEVLQRLSDEFKATRAKDAAPTETEPSKKTTAKAATAKAAASKAAEAPKETNKG